jgi:nucleoside-diphosphate-sugar epimerase
MDLTNDIPQTHHCDVIVHAAAKAGLVRSWLDFTGYVNSNLIVTRNMLRETMPRTNRFVFISSSSVYGPVATGPEDSLMAPTNPYGITKIAGELLVKSYSEELSVPYTIIRPFSIYGPRQRPDMMHHIFIRKILQGESITVDWDGGQARCNTYVSDLVNGIVQSFSPKGENQAFNIGGGQTVTVLETLHLLEKLLGRTTNWISGKKRAGDQRITVANIEKAKRLLGYSPEIDLEFGLCQQIKWQAEVMGCLSSIPLMPY